MVPPTSPSPHTRTPSTSSLLLSSSSSHHLHHPSSSSSTTTTAATTARVPGQQQEYSCILCKQRKVRCDRGNPCSGCVRAGVDCVPGVRQPYKRRKRIHHHHQNHNGSSPSRGGDTDTGHSPRVGDNYYSAAAPARALDNRPTQEEPRSQQPQIPTYGQYGIPFSLFDVLLIIHVPTLP